MAAEDASQLHISKLQIPSSRNRCGFLHTYMYTSVYSLHKFLIVRAGTPGTNLGNLPQELLPSYFRRNSMAVDVLRETFYDPFDGRKDVKDARWRWLLTGAASAEPACWGRWPSSVAWYNFGKVCNDVQFIYQCQARKVSALLKGEHFWARYVWYSLQAFGNSHASFSELLQWHCDSLVFIFILIIMEV